MAREYANVAYYPSWMVYRGKPPSSLQISTITHVLYAFVGVNEDGTLRPLDEWADLHKEVDGETGCLSALSKLKNENPHIKTLVSFGGGTASAEFPALAENAEARETFAGEARKYCDLHNLDGIDIDWEHPKTPEQGRNYVELVRAVREALPSPEYLVTTALPVGEYCLRNINLNDAAEVLDFLNLMTYDFTGNWTEVSGHHAQLRPPQGDLSTMHETFSASSSAGINHILANDFPSHKILLGIPVYARYFPEATGPGEPFSDANEMEYCDLPDEWVAGADVDKTVVAASFVDEEERGFVSFDVPGTVSLKADYVKAMGLGGLFYWTGVGDRDGDQSLVVTGYNELKAEE